MTKPFEQSLPQDMFLYRKMTTIISLALATIHVLIPSPYRTITLVMCIIIISIQMFLYGYREYRIFMKYRKNIFNHKRKWKIDELDDKTKSLILDWTTKIGKKYKIVITEGIRDFQSKGFTKTILINPKELMNSDPRNNEASFYHEVGHIEKFERFMIEIILVFTVTLIYAYSLITIDSMRGEFPFIPLIGTWGIFVLIKTWVSWRNEYRADKFAFEKVGYDNLKVMLDNMQFPYDSETHPSPDKRRKKIKRSGK